MFRCRGWRQITPIACAVAICVSACVSVDAETHPPINGLIVSVGVKESQAVETAVVGVLEEVGIAARFVRGEGRVSVPEGLKRLSEGTTVLVQDTNSVDVPPAEGVVTRIDRRRRQILVLFTNRMKEELQIVEPYASDLGNATTASQPSAPSMSIFFHDASGRRYVLHANKS